MRYLQIGLMVIVGLSFVACGYTQSALEYSYEGTKRVQAGYDAKAKMTESMLAYLAQANEGCGVKVEIINNVPVTTVKECIRPADVLASVDKVEIVKPQEVKDMLQSAGDFFVKATGLVVPTASVYYGYKMNSDNQHANVAMNKSNNEASLGMWQAYTGNFQNSTSVSESTTNIEKEVTNETSTSVTDTISVP